MPALVENTSVFTILLKPNVPQHTVRFRLPVDITVISEEEIITMGSVLKKERCHGM